MKSFKRKLLVFFALLLMPLVAEAESNIQIPFKTTSLDITSRIKILRTDNHKITPATPNFDSMFKIQNQKKVKTSYNNHHIWLKINIKNVSTNHLRKLIILNTTLSGKVSLFEKKNNHYTNTQNGGSFFGYKYRSRQSLYPSFNLNFMPGEGKIVYLKINSKHQFSTTIKITNNASFNKSEHVRILVIYFYIGAVLSMLLYNLFIYLYTKDIINLYYTIYSLFISSVVLSFTGGLDYLFQSLHPGTTHYLINLISMTAIIAVVYTQRILQTKILSFKIDLIYRLIMVLAILINIVTIFPFYSSIIPVVTLLIDIMIISFICLSIIASALSYRKNITSSTYYIASWAFLFMGIIIYYSMRHGVLPINNFTNHSILWGNLIQFTILSLGMARKVSMANFKEKEEQIKDDEKQKYNKLVRIINNDISNSLFIIKGFTELIIKNPEKLDKMEIWQKIDKAAINMSAILTAIKQDEPIDIKAKTIVNTEVYSLEIINESLFIFKDIIKNKNIQINCHDINEELVIKAEKLTLLNNVFNNVLSNAINFSYQNGTIEISTSTTLKYNIIEVKDNGIGIPKEMLDSFSKSNSIPTRVGTKGEVGTGLGMGSIKNYMAIYGGKLEIQSKVKSEKNKSSGTKILLYFPNIRSKEN